MLPNSIIRDYIVLSTITICFIVIYFIAVYDLSKHVRAESPIKNETAFLSDLLTANVLYGKDKKTGRCFACFMSKNHISV